MESRAVVKKKENIQFLPLRKRRENDDLLRKEFGTHPVDGITRKFNWETRLGQKLFVHLAGRFVN